VKPEERGASYNGPASGASTRRRGIRSVAALGAAALLLAALLLTLPYRAGAAGVTQSEERGSYYFRLKAKYSHAGQPVDFDIVVGCGIRVDRYHGGDSGFLASRYPRFFVQRTHDNHAVMQIVPIACRGETTESGIVPADFLPGVIWFDTPGDYRFGIAYVSEDAFESPNGQLKFTVRRLRRRRAPSGRNSRSARLTTRVCGVGITTGQVIGLKMPSVSLRAPATKSKQHMLAAVVA
jgi:hypothetical protein